MPRESIIPQQIVREEIRSLQEFPAALNEPGRVSVMVGRVDGAGAFVLPQTFESYTIEGENFAELTGAATPWAPDKPIGTYRNSDLWHFIDLLRQRSLGPNTVLGGA